MSRIRQKKPARKSHGTTEISAYRKRPAEKAGRSQASLPHALAGAAGANEAGNSGGTGVPHASRTRTKRRTPAPLAGFAN